jgi:hypothetical protein
MSNIHSDHFPSLGIPISRLENIIDELGGPAKAGALSCGEFFVKCIRPVCKENGLPLAQQIFMNDESTRTAKARCSPADTLVIQGGAHGFMETCTALMLHLGLNREFPSECSADEPVQAPQVIAISRPTS